MDQLSPTKRTNVLSFGSFELDSSSGELRKHGLRVRLAGQPLQILLMLLARPGELVTRDEIRQRLWSTDTFVDFDAGLSSAVRKVREALGDSADNPRFIETLPKRGYRFVAPVQQLAPAPIAPEAPSKPAMVPSASAVPPSPSVVLQPAALVRRRNALILAASVVVVGTVGFMYGRAPRVGATKNVAPDAYQAYLNGVAATGRGGVAGFRNAVAYLEEAVRKQPDFALGYATLANAQLQLVYSGSNAPRDVVPKAEAWARKAIALDDSLPLAHRTLGSILQIYYWRWEEGRLEIDKARHAEPDSAETHTEAAFGLLRAGRTDDAIAESERARRLDPLSFGTALNVGAILRQAQQYDRAIAEFQRGVALNPLSARAHFQLGITYVFVVRWTAAIEEFQAALRVTPDNTRFQAYLGYSYAKAGRRDDAVKVLNNLKAQATESYVSAFGLALIDDALGDRTGALANIIRACEDHAIEFSQLKQYPPFETIASDARYLAVMRTVGDR